MANPLSRPNNSADRSWIGLYLDDKWMTNATIRASALAATYIHGLTLTINWQDIQPTDASTFNWTTLDTRIANAIGAGKWLKINLLGTDHVGSNRIPAWAEVGIATVTDTPTNRIVLWDTTWMTRWGNFVALLGPHLTTIAGIKIAYVEIAGLNGGAEMAITQAGIADYTNGGYSNAAITTGLRLAWATSATAIQGAFGGGRESFTPGSVIVGGVQLADTLTADVIAIVGADKTVLGNASYNLTDTGVGVTIQRAHRNVTWLSALCEQPIAIGGSPDPDPPGTVNTIFTSAISTEGFGLLTAHPDALGVDNNLNANVWPASYIAGYPANTTPIDVALAALLTSEMTDAPEAPAPAVPPAGSISSTPSREYDALLTTTADTMLDRRRGS